MGYIYDSHDAENFILFSAACNQAMHVAYMQEQPCLLGCSKGQKVYVGANNHCYTLPCYYCNHMKVRIENEKASALNCFKTTLIPAITHRESDLQLLGYLSRWCFIERNNIMNIYAHNIISADMPILHTHPWDFITLCITGGYTEVTVDGENVISEGDIVFRPYPHKHYIKTVLPRTWTVVITGPFVSDWGYIDPVTKEYIPHEEYNGAREIKVIRRNNYGKEEEYGNRT